jgi:hypothetical protein
MKNKNVVVGLALALAAIASCETAQAQIGGARAAGDVYQSSGGSGNMGQTDYLYTDKQADHASDSPSPIQNYISPDVFQTNQHTYKDIPNVNPMMNSDSSSHGLNHVSTAPMATGTLSIGNTPFPSGQFDYGFAKASVFPPAPYHGAYKSGASGSMLPNVSTGSVDFNTVDTTGIAPAGMRSPGRGMAAPIGRPVVQMPNSSSSTQSTQAWLNTFFGF